MEYLVEERGWSKWEKHFEDFTIEEGLSFHEIVIPTIDFVRNIEIGRRLLIEQHHLLTPGHVGTAKTTNALSLMSQYLDTNFESIAISLSARTTCQQIVNTVFSSIQKRKQDVFAPANGKKAVFFVDDLNMPQKEQYGAQPPLELLRQYIE